MSPYTVFTAFNNILLNSDGSMITKAFPGLSLPTNLFI